jgi:STE24 endopeptidase
LLRHKFEYEADRFVVKTLGRGEMLASSLIKMTKDNLGFPIYDPLYSIWHRSHPSDMERLEAIRAEMLLLAKNN